MIQRFVRKPKANDFYVKNKKKYFMNDNHVRGEVVSIFHLIQ